MLQTQILSILLITVLRVVNGDPYSSFVSKEAPANFRSRISQRNAKNKAFNDSQLTRNLVPLPSPRETIGDYFDKYANILDGVSNTTQMSEESESELTNRDLVRVTGYLKSLWSIERETFNISISRCIRFSDTIGTWTNTNGTTTENATLENINSDLRTRFNSKAELAAHLNARLLDNAVRSLSEAEAFLNSTVCGYETTKPAQPSTSPLPVPADAIRDPEDASYPDMTHDELRKLHSSDALNTKFWAADGYWTGVLMSMGAGAGIGGALYKGFYNRNATNENVAIVCFTAAGLIMTRGIIERLFMNGSLQFIEASVISAFTAWFRQAVAAVMSLQREYMRQVGPDNHVSGCLEEIVIEDSVDSLPAYSQPQAGIIELVPVGTCL